MLSIIGNISMSEGTCLVRPSLEKSCLHWFARCATFTLTCLVVCSLLEHTTTLSQVASQLPGPWRTSCPLAGKPSWIQFESAHNTLMQMPFPNYPACGYREPHEKETATGTQPEEDEDRSINNITKRFLSLKLECKVPPCLWACQCNKSPHKRPVVHYNRLKPYFLPKQPSSNPEWISSHILRITTEMKILINKMKMLCQTLHLILSYITSSTPTKSSTYCFNFPSTRLTPSMVKPETTASRPIYR